MQEKTSTKNKKYLTSGEFARELGLCKQTVINYQKEGKLPERRSPYNNYRVFTWEDVNKFKRSIHADNGKD